MGRETGPGFGSGLLFFDEGEGVGWVWCMGREAGFSAAPRAKARATSVEMTIFAGGEGRTGNGKGNGKGQVQRLCVGW